MNILTNKYTTNNNHIQFELTLCTRVRSNVVECIRSLWTDSVVRFYFYFFENSEAFFFIAECWMEKKSLEEWVYFLSKLKSRFSTWLDWWVVHWIYRIRTITTHRDLWEDAINANELPNIEISDLDFRIYSIYDGKAGRERSKLIGGFGWLLINIDKLINGQRYHRGNPSVKSRWESTLSHHVRMSPLHGWSILQGQKKVRTQFLTR